MPKEFYTERDIEDMFKRGVMSLEINDNIVLTELAYEKAKRLGLQLVQNAPEKPPSAPVRPYLSQKRNPSTPVSPGRPILQPVVPPHLAANETSDLHQRIRTAVLARLGTQIDPALLDDIINRVLRSTGIK